MSDNAIEVEGLHKVYRVYPSPFDRLLELVTFGKVARHHRVHALNDVSFEVPRGSMLGVIGSNGAGKSTLLRVLANTASPTRGRVSMRGDVASLLELGTGFHEAFSGRQNIRLNASLMGMKAKEIEASIEKILDYSELGAAIDRPLRTYSSGMVLRLGFAVATLKDPEILILDEILAVGDDHFQRKSNKRIQRLRESGATILLCSHAITEIKRLSDRVMWIDEGRVMAYGDPEEVTEAYTEFERSRADVVRDVSKGRFGISSGGKDPKIESIRVKDAAGDDARAFTLGDELWVKMAYRVPRETGGLNLGVAIYRHDNLLVYGAGTHFDKNIEVPSKPGSTYELEFRIPSLRLRRGDYYVIGFVYDEKGLHVYDHVFCEQPIAVLHSTGEPGVYVPPKQDWSFERTKATQASS